MDECLPIFTTDYSIGRSILTVDALKRGKDNKLLAPLKNDSPVSILAIAEAFDIKKTVIVDNSFTGYWQMYKNFSDIGREFVFGWKVEVVNNAAQKDEESTLTGSNIIIFLKNSQSYYSLVKWVTVANCKNHFNRSRLDWQNLSDLYDTDLFEVASCGYSGFISRNLTRYNACCAPKWGKIKPLLFYQEQNLPIDNLIKDGIFNYAKANNFETCRLHQSYYLRDQDSEANLVFRCINRRSTLSKPENPMFCSTGFSYESYLKQYNPDKLELLSA